MVKDGRSINEEQPVGYVKAGCCTAMCGFPNGNFLSSTGKKCEKDQTAKGMARR